MYVGREWPNLAGLAPRHTQDRRFIGIHFFLARARKKTDTVFITPADAEENIDR